MPDLQVMDHLGGAYTSGGLGSPAAPRLGQDVKRASLNGGCPKSRDTVIGSTCIPAVIINKDS